MKAFKTLESFNNYMSNLNQEQESNAQSKRLKQLAIEFNSLVDIEEYRSNNKEAWLYLEKNY
jgi:Leucine-rich repeat (LRR) protein